MTSVSSSLLLGEFWSGGQRNARHPVCCTITLHSVQSSLLLQVILGQTSGSVPYALQRVVMRDTHNKHPRVGPLSKSVVFKTALKLWAMLQSTVLHIGRAITGKASIDRSKPSAMLCGWKWRGDPASHQQGGSCQDTCSCMFELLHRLSTACSFKLISCSEPSCSLQSVEDHRPIFPSSCSCQLTVSTGISTD